MRKFEFFAGILLSMFVLLQMACARGSGETTQQSTGTGQTTVTKTVIANPTDLQNSFMKIAQDVTPTVVEVNVLQVVNQQPSSMFQYFFGTPNQGPQEQAGLGSGVMIRKDGNTVYVVTNYHVVENADQISVALQDGRNYTATVVGSDERTDLALIKFTSNEDLPLAKLADSDLLEVGNWVLAIGNPYGFESTVTAGIVSALGRSAQPGTPVGSFTQYIQTDAAINPGNSGGALVNLDGEVTGINSWIASQSGGNTGLGFAIPSNVVSKAIESFIKNGKIIYGWLGVTSLDLSSTTLPGLADSLKLGDSTGVLIDNVYQDSPAAKAGLLPGDFITHVNGTKVDNGTDFAREVGGSSPGAKMNFTLIRGGKKIDLAVTLEEQPSANALNNAAKMFPGVDILPITKDIRNQVGIPNSVNGVIAIRVLNGSPTAAAGIQRGDIITSIGNSKTSDPLSFYSALNNMGPQATFEINRGGQTAGVRVAK